MADGDFVGLAAGAEYLNSATCHGAATDDVRYHSRQDAKHHEDESGEPKKRHEQDEAPRQVRFSKRVSEELLSEHSQREKLQGKKLPFGLLNALDEEVAKKLQQSSSLSGAAHGDSDSPGCFNRGATAGVDPALANPGGSVPANQKVGSGSGSDASGSPDNGAAAAQFAAASGEGSGSGFAAESMSGNQPPVANDQSLFVGEDGTLPITLPVSDSENDPLTTSIVVGPTNGQVAPGSSGTSWTYTPNANFNGSDSFTYQANDGTSNSNVGTISITVIAGNDPPVLTNPGPQFSQPGEVVSLAMFATDIDSSGLTYSASSLPNFLGINPTTGVISGTVDSEAGELVFHTTITVTDGQANDFVMFDWTIRPGTPNEPPTADDQTVTLDEDAPTDITLTGTDPESADLGFSVETLPTNGTLTGTGATRTYTPNANFHGTDSFTVRANDGELNSLEVGTISITVSPVNDPPVAAEDTANTRGTKPVDIDVLANDTDVDEDSLSIGTLYQPTNGTAEIVTVGSTQQIRYTANADFSGTDTLAYELLDGQGGADIGIIVVTVAANSPPVVTPITGRSDQAGAQISLQVAATDSDGDTLQYSDEGSVVSLGTLGLGINSSGLITGTIPSGAVGDHSVTITVKDGFGGVASTTFTWTVTSVPVNRRPTADNQSVILDEDTAKDIVLTGADPDGTTPDFIVVANPTNGTLSGSGATLRYTPNLNFNGTDTFKFKTSDGQLDSADATVTIAVAPVNDLMVVTPIPAQTNKEGDQVAIQVVASDVDDTATDSSDDIIYSATNLPDGITIDQNGLISGIIAAGAARAIAYPSTIKLVQGPETVEISFPWTVDPYSNVPVVSIEASDPFAAERPVNTGAFTISVAGTLTQSITVRFQVNGSAMQGMVGRGRGDYRQLDGFQTRIQESEFHEIAFGPGNLTRTIVITPFNDQIPEIEENVLLTLLPPTTGGSQPPAYTVAQGAGQAEVKIADGTRRQQKIDSVDFVQQGTTGTLSDDNPADFDGGYRFFPDAKTTGDGANNVVRVRATVTGRDVQPGTTVVYFRSFDVDDPSRDAGIDPNDTALGNFSAAGLDNRGTFADADFLNNPNATLDAPGVSKERPGFDPTYQGRLRGVGDTKWAPNREVVGAKVQQVGGVMFAEVDLATTFAPGDNFRVLASLDGEELKDINILDGVPTKGNNILVGLPNQNRRFTGAATSQLSVWRRLHIETDRMQQPTMATPGIDATSATIVAAPQRLGNGEYRIRTNASILVKDELVGGLLWDPTTKTAYDIVSNTVGTVQSAQVIGVDNVVRPGAFTVKINQNVPNVVLNQFAGYTAWVLSEGVQTRYTILGNDAGLNEVYLKDDGQGQQILPGYFLRIDLSDSAVTIRVPANAPVPVAQSVVTLYQDDFVRGDGQNAPKFRVDPSSDEVFTSMYQFLQASSDRRKNRFADAYIEPEYTVLASSSNTIAPIAHLSGDDLVKLGKDNGSSFNSESDLFWTVYVSSAYEQTRLSDGDPDKSYRVGGQPQVGEGTSAGATLATANPLLGDQVTAIFVESIRDVTATNAARATFDEALGTTTVHEIGHQFNVAIGQPGEHRNDGNNIMSLATWTLGLGRSFFATSDVSFIRLRQKSPGNP